ncbi:anti-sigma-F factor Fin family protein [Oceanobacillus sojae]|uniref:anti-sigma-F factor Fin family protein n=1 Tax=Oceanobacillus sojae TaxID=582851 RepID=UPI0021A332CF|nr:anti-sigma-F factor Fin family protein [Oceanobacillus sojae]MCT1901815.1 anti-sigma-F factor Fin family protein [Oceanobacillus sojae]
MVIYYGCRHCGKELGVLNHTEIDLSLRFLNLLEEQDISEMIVFEKDGDFRLEVICEHCQQVLEEHPNYHELDHFLQ